MLKGRRPRPKVTVGLLGANHLRVRKEPSTLGICSATRAWLRATLLADVGVGGRVILVGVPINLSMTHFLPGSNCAARVGSSCSAPFSSMDIVGTAGLKLGTKYVGY